MFEKLMMEAAYYAELGKYEKAREAICGVLEEKPDYGRAHYLLGVCNHNLGQYEDVPGNCQESLRCGFVSDAVHYLLSSAYFRLGQYELSEEQFQIAYRLNPRDAVAIARQGAQLASLGRKKEANDLFQQAFALDPEQPQIRYLKNKLAVNSGNKESRQEALEDMMSGGATEYDKLVFLGDYYCKARKYRQAEEAFRQAYLMHPDEYVARQLAYCEAHTKAYDSFRKLLKSTIMSGYYLLKMLLFYWIPLVSAFTLLGLVVELTALLPVAVLLSFGCLHAGYFLMGRFLAFTRKIVDPVLTKLIVGQEM